MGGAEDTTPGTEFAMVADRRSPRKAWCAYLVPAGLLLAAVAARGADPPGSAEALWKKLEPFTRPPAEFAGKYGHYRSPLQFADGSLARSPADWDRRRAEIVKTWHERLGPWPPLVER